MMQFTTLEKKIRDKYPELDPGDRNEKIQELVEKNFNIYLDSRVAAKLVANKDFDMPQFFVETLHVLLTEMGMHNERTKRINVYFKPHFNPEDGEWSIEE